MSCSVQTWGKPNNNNKKKETDIGAKYKINTITEVTPPRVQQDLIGLRREQCGCWLAMSSATLPWLLCGCHKFYLPELNYNLMFMCPESEDLGSLPSAYSFLAVPNHHPEAGQPPTDAPPSHCWVDKGGGGRRLYIHNSTGTHTPICDPQETRYTPSGVCFQCCLFVCQQNYTTNPISMNLAEVYHGPRWNPFSFQKYPIKTDWLISNYC